MKFLNVLLLIFIWAANAFAVDTIDKKFCVDQLVAGAQADKLILKWKARVANRIKMSWREKHWTQMQFAQNLARVSGSKPNPGYISEIINNKRTPNFDTIEKLARIFEVDVRFLAAVDLLEPLLLNSKGTFIEDVESTHPIHGVLAKVGAIKATGEDMQNERITSQYLLDNKSLDELVEEIQKRGWIVRLERAPK